MTTYTTRVCGCVRMISFLLVAVAMEPVSPAQPGFAVASIRPNAPGFADKRAGEQEGITLSPATLIMRRISLRACIRWAYDLRDSQLIGPGWMANERFDIAATAAQPASPSEMRVMLQRVLSERFQLAVRREARALPVYAMTVKKRDKLRGASGGECGMVPLGGALEFRNCTMADFAERLANRPFKLDRPVVDETGMEGRFHFDVRFAENLTELKHTLEGMERGSLDGAPSMLTILQEQLGLSFKGRKAPVESLIVERALRVPTEN